MPPAKENAISLYMEGIQNGKPQEAVKAYTGAQYKQHSTGVADGAEGFIAFFEPFLKRNPVREFKVVRSLQDGSKVFLQVYQNIANGETEWLTTDFFESDSEGKIIEHWDVISAFKGPNSSGRTSIDGPTEVVDLEKTDANRKLVTDFINICLIQRQTDKFAEYINAQNYMQHNTETGDGMEAFLQGFVAADSPLKYQECFMAVAEGNFVATLNRATLNGQDQCLVDVYRVENGKIVEHWDNCEPVPPKSEWANSGKF